MAGFHKQEAQSKRCVPSLKQIVRVRNETRTKDCLRTQLAVLRRAKYSVYKFGSQPPVLETRVVQS